MFRVKLTIVTATAAVIMLCTLGAASASASWFVAGAELKTSAALATTGVVDELATFLVPEIKLSIQCGGGTVDGLKPEVIAGNTLKAQSLKFLDCNTTQPATGCALEEANQTISTNAISVRAFLGPGESVRDLFAPQTGSTFGTLQFSETNTCAFNSEEPLKGEFIANAPNGQLEGASEAVSGLGSVENNSLEFGSGNKAFVDGGGALLKLASGSKWSFK